MSKQDPGQQHSDRLPARVPKEKDALIHEEAEVLFIPTFNLEMEEAFSSINTKYIYCPWSSQSGFLGLFAYNQNTVRQSGNYAMVYGWVGGSTMVLLFLFGHIMIFLGLHMNNE